MEKLRFNLLLAEDDLEHQELIIEITRQLSNRWHVFRVFDGRRLLNYLNDVPQEWRPDVLIMDCQLPIISAVEILNRLMQMKKYRDVPKVMFSSKPSEEEKQRCGDAGAGLYLRNSHRPSEMKAMLIQIFRFVAEQNYSSLESLLDGRGKNAT